MRGLRINLFSTTGYRSLTLNRSQLTDLAMLFQICPEAGVSLPVTLSPSVWGYLAPDYFLSTGFAFPKRITISNVDSMSNLISSSLIQEGFGQILSHILIAAREDLPSLASRRYSISRRG